jgi:LysM repeat protein
MQIIRQIGVSFLLAFLSVALVVGGISLALAESYVPAIPPTPTNTQAPLPVFDTPTPQPIILATDTLSVPTATFPPPTSCPPPTGWIAITIQPGDDLVSLALRYQSTPENLLIANCLFSTDLPTGSILYVPPFPTQTSVPCGPPPGWVRYIVRPGNTIYSLSQAFGVSSTQLQFANCLSPNQYILPVGQSIWVPNYATRTPRATGTATLTPVSIIFPTVTRTATVTPTATKIPTSTVTNVPTSTATNVPTVTQTPVPSFTPTTPTATVAASPTTPPTATATITAFPSATSIPSTFTFTPVP